MQKGLFTLSEKDDGSITISYEDYDVKCFGGGSYEAIYSIDAKNREKLENLLKESFPGELKDTISAKFGERLDENDFDEYLNENGVEYELFTWID